jgi:hypothetical protein
MGFGCCIGQVAILVFGLIALIKGEFKLSANRVVSGGAARVVGALLLLSLALGPGGAFMYGFVVGANKGMQMAKQGKQQFNQADKAALEEEIRTPAIIITLAGTAVPLVAALIVAIAASAPVRRPVRDDFEDEDVEDRPPRRRNGEDDEDDRPSRRHRRDDEGDEHIKEL